MRRKTLFVTDLDGTLLGPDGTLSQTTVSLLNHAISRGALFSVATARTPATVSVLLRQVELRLPLVVMTGAALWDKNSGAYSDVQYFAPEKVNEIVEAYRGAGGGGFLYTLPPSPDGKDTFRIYHIGSLNRIEREFMEERLTSPFKRFEVPESGNSILPGEIRDAVLFFGMQPEQTALDIYGRLGDIKDINPMFYHDWHGDEVAEIEAFPPGATKARAIRRLARKAGADRVVVFGDNLNDLSMMEAADWSVAVGNAVNEAKEAADQVIGTNCADSVARCILEMLNEG